uniref:Ribonuclease P n=1 Tax=Acrobeloides nanus TaxID=290746 RepID=A0A914CQS9_9BILA
MSKNSLRRLTFQLEVSSQTEFDPMQFRELIECSLKTLLGVAGPSYTFGEYDPQTQKGSIIVNSNDLNQIWATLSLYGRHLHHNIALHLNSITIPNE